MNVMTDMLIISSTHIQWRQDNNGTLPDETTETMWRRSKLPFTDSFRWVVYSSLLEALTLASATMFFNRALFSAVIVPY
jgi:hypothetical protein